ncbi:hypothetical protein MNBD_GAMMA11-1036 [hydrothermal vent metagenome]|uniref:Uncharacterized protein n=1 Tax=hydrothermal vent metagenome TaxID=652676 RepID=A0A3B0WS36_9ZZZZ
MFYLQLKNTYTPNLKKRSKLIVICCILLLGFGCAKNENEEWMSAKKADTIDAYVEFLKHFPESEFSSEARNHLRDYFRALQKDAYDALGSENEKSRTIYEKILSIDPNNALALNNQAYLLIAGFNNGRPKDQNIFLTRDKIIIKETIELLQQAKLNAGSRKIASQIIQTSLVFQVGEKLELIEIRAAQLPMTDTDSILLKKLVELNLEKLHELLDKYASKELSDSDNRLRVLSESLKASYITEIRKLIKNGADVNIKNKWDATPLLMAAQEGYTQIVTVLLKANADVNAAEKTNGATPLHMAAENGHTQIVAILLKANADVNVAGIDGGTPIYIAAQNGHTQIVATLLKANADVNVAGKDGSSPLHMAAQNGHTQIITALLKAHAKVNATMTSGITPLYMAAQNGHTKSVEVLLKSGADINAYRKTTGAAPLHISVYYGHTKTVVALLKGNADVNAAMTSSATPLYIAAINGHTKIAAALLKANADTNIKYHDAGKYYSPLSAAKAKGHKDIVNMLKNLSHD